MKNCSNKDTVLKKFPELKVTRCSENPELFIMLNKHGVMFSELMTSYSAKKTWEVAHNLLVRGVLKPYKETKSTHDVKFFHQNKIKETIDIDFVLKDLF